MTGKEKCKILREIRASIAEENDIQFVTEACPFKGECKGTCPKCEAELAYLEEELKKRKRNGKIIKISIAAAAAAGIALGATALKDTIREKLDEMTEQTELTGAVEAYPDSTYQVQDENTDKDESTDNDTDNNNDEEPITMQDIEIIYDNLF